MALFLPPAGVTSYQKYPNRDGRRAETPRKYPTSSLTPNNCVRRSKWETAENYLKPASGKRSPVPDWTRINMWLSDSREKSPFICRFSKKQPCFLKSELHKRVREFPTLTTSNNHSERFCVRQLGWGKCVLLLASSKRTSRFFFQKSELPDNSKSCASTSHTSLSCVNLTGELEILLIWKQFYLVLLSQIKPAVPVRLFVAGPICPQFSACFSSKWCSLLIPLLFFATRKVSSRSHITKGTCLEYWSVKAWFLHQKKTNKLFKLGVFFYCTAVDHKKGTRSSFRIQWTQGVLHL